MSRRTLLGVGAAGIIAAVAACAPNNPNNSGGGTSAGGGASTGSGSGGQPNADGKITAAISYELGTNGYDPMTTSAALTVAVNWHTLEGLTELDVPSGKPYAALAADMPKADGTTVDVTLRDGAKFHDGSDVTADDVVFSFTRVLDPKNSSLYATFIPFIKEVTKKDDKTVTFTLAYPVGVFAERLSVVKIVPKAAVEKDAKGFDNMPIGTGPYKMVDNGASSKKVVFQRFDDYTGPKKALAKDMEWQIIPDPSTRTNAMQTKSVQAMDSVPYLSIDQLKTSSKVESVQGFGLLFVMFNTSKGHPFADIKNRQAFLYSLDVDKIVKVGLSGQGAPATSFVQKTHPAYQQAKVVYQLDQAKAKQLFGQTGLTTVNLMATDHDWVQQCTPIVQQSLEAVGQKVNFTQKQSADLYNTITGKPDAYDVAVAPGDPSVFGQDADLLMRWWYGNDAWMKDRCHWTDDPAYKQLQDLLDQGLEATDTTKQMDLWHQAFDLISEQVVLYPIFHRAAPTAWDDQSLVNFTPISVTGLDFVGVGSTK